MGRHQTAHPTPGCSRACVIWRHALARSEALLRGLSHPTHWSACMFCVGAWRGFCADIWICFLHFSTLCKQPGSGTLRCSRHDSVRSPERAPAETATGRWSPRHYLASRSGTRFINGGHWDKGVRLVATAGYSIATTTPFRFSYFRFMPFQRYYTNRRPELVMCEETSQARLAPSASVYNDTPYN